MNGELLVFLLLIFQPFHVLFHSSHHISSSEKHKQCETRKNVIISPKFKTVHEAHIRDCNKDHDGNNEPEIEHDFVIRLHSFNFKQR